MNQYICIFHDKLVIAKGFARTIKKLVNEKPQDHAILVALWKNDKFMIIDNTNFESFKNKEYSDDDFCSMLSDQTTDKKAAVKLIIEANLGSTGGDKITDRAQNIINMLQPKLLILVAGAGCKDSMDDFATNKHLNLSKECELLETSTDIKSLTCLNAFITPVNLAAISQDELFIASNSLDSPILDSPRYDQYVDIEDLTRNPEEVQIVTAQRFSLCDRLTSLLRLNLFNSFSRSSNQILPENPENQERSYQY